jgi:hypothetical protein
MSSDRVRQQLQQQLGVDSTECGAVALVTHGAAHAFQIAQDSLRFALAAAKQEDFPLNEDGRVHLPASPMVRHDPDYYEWCRTEQKRLQGLVDGAVQAAIKVDSAAHEELDKLSTRTNVTSLDDALNGDFGDASKLEVDLIADAVPGGGKDQAGQPFQQLVEQGRADRLGLVRLARLFALGQLGAGPDVVRLLDRVGSRAGGHPGGRALR